MILVLNMPFKVDTSKAHLSCICWI